MRDDTESNEQKIRASPWPMLIAVGLAIAEVGVVFGLQPVAVGGLILLLVTVTGILRESGYILRPSRTAGVLGGLFVGIGVVLVVFHQGGPPVRGHSFIFAGGLALVAIPFWRRFIQRRSHLMTEAESTE